jgi:hypothetical protein
MQQFLGLKTNWQNKYLKGQKIDRPKRPHLPGGFTGAEFGDGAPPGVGAVGGAPVTVKLY